MTDDTGSPAPGAPSPVVSIRRRLGAYTLDLLVTSSPLVVFFGMPERGHWGVLFALVLGVGSCVPLFLVLQGTSLFRRGRTLGMAYFGLELSPRESFGVAFLSGLQLLVASPVFALVYDYVTWGNSISASGSAWIASAVFALMVLAPNFLSIVLPGHRSLAERICQTRLVESNAAPGVARAKPRLIGYVVDALLFASALVPCLLLSTTTGRGGDVYQELIVPLRPGVFTAGALLVFQLGALFSTRETIGTRAWRSAPQALDTRRDLTR